MEEEKYLSLEELEALFASSPLWLKSGRGKYTAEESHATVQFIEQFGSMYFSWDMPPMQVEGYLYPGEIKVRETGLFAHFGRQRIDFTMKLKKES